MKNTRKREQTERTQLTERMIGALDTPKKRRKIYDQKVPSLGLRIFPSGTKSFFWYRTGGGAIRWETIGTWPAISLEQARAAALEFDSADARWKLDGARADQNPFNEKLVARSEPTLNNLWEDYIARHIQPHAKNPARAEANLRYSFKKHLTPLKDFKLSMISPERVRDLHLQIGEKRKAAANRLIEDLRAAFGFAIQTGMWKGTNPCLGVTFFHRPKRKRFVTPDEMPKLFAALKTETNPDVVDYVNLSLWTGARKSEVLSMRWADIALSDNRWTVPFPKNSESYDVALTPEAIGILRRRLKGRKENNAWVFPSFGKSGHIVDFKKRWKALVTRAGLTNLRQHDLRRTLGSWQAGQGTSLLIIGKSLGHKSQAATAIYSQLDLDPVRQSVNSATKAILAAGKKKPRGMLTAKAASQKG